MNINRKKITKRIVKEYQPKQFPLLNLYILVVMLFQLVGQATQTWLHLLKPVPIIMMIVYIRMKMSNSRDYLMPGLVEKGLIISVVGDIFIMFDEVQAFTLGTIAFFCTQILYLISFNIGQKIRQANLKVRLLQFLGVIIFVANLVYNLYDMWNVFPNKILFPAYGILITLVIISAIMRYQQSTPYSYGFILFGIILFGLSDHILSVIMFYNTFTPMKNTVVMLLYYLGQYFIMHGSLHFANMLFTIQQLNKSRSSYE